MLAAIDLGSNSFRMHVGRHNGEVIEVVRSMRESTRMAAGLDTRNMLSQEAMHRGIDALYRLGDVLRAYPLEAVRAVATNTMRVATNAGDFLSAAEKALGYPVEVISGEEEARLIYMGIASQLANPGELRLVIDIGGGSTELIVGQGQEIEQAESVGVGTVWQSRHFFPQGVLDEASFDNAIMTAQSRFEDVLPPEQRPRWKNVYGSSGTMRAIGEIIARNRLGDEGVTLQSLEALKRRLIEFGRIDLISLEKVRSERAESIVGGLTILMGLMQALEIRKLVPVEGGLRLGVMWDLHLRATRRDRRDLSVRDFLRRFAADETRAARVAEYAAALYAQVKPGANGLSRLLEWSALLHEVGLAVSPTNYHKHGAYLVENADLPGFTTREQKSMGRLILGQRGNLRKLGEALDDPNTARAVLALRLAVMFLHVGADADFGELRLKMKNRIDLEVSSSLVTAHPTLPYWIEREREAWEGVGISFSIKIRS